MVMVKSVVVACALWQMLVVILASSEEESQEENVVEYTVAFNGNPWETYETLYQLRENEEFVFPNGGDRSDPQRGSSMQKTSELIVQIHSKIDTIIQLLEDVNSDASTIENTRNEINQDFIQALQQMEKRSIYIEINSLHERLQAVEQATIQRATVRQNLDRNDKVDELQEIVETEGYTPSAIAQLETLVTQQNNSIAAYLLSEYLLFHRPDKLDAKHAHKAVELLQASVKKGNLRAKLLLPILYYSAVWNDHPALKTSSENTDTMRMYLQDVSMAAPRAQAATANLVLGYRKLFNLDDTSAAVSPSTCTTALVHISSAAQEAIAGLNGSDEEGSGSSGGNTKMGTKLSEEWQNQAISSSQTTETEASVEYYRFLAKSPTNEVSIQAANRLGEIYFFGDEQANVAVDRRRAAQFFAQAADGGLVNAQANLGLLYANGIGVEQNNETALKFFGLAAEQGNGLGLNGLGYMHLNGQGVEKNTTRAVEYFERAVEAGYVDSHNFLGSAYLEGLGVEANTTKAFEHFKVASDHGISSATYNLGVLYLQGLGTEYSCEKSVDKFREVAITGYFLHRLPFSDKKGQQLYHERRYEDAFLHFILASQYGSRVALSNGAFLLENSFLDGQDAFFPQLLQPTQGQQHERCDSDPDPQGCQERTRRETIEHWQKSKALELFQIASQLQDPEALRKMGDCLSQRPRWALICENDVTQAIAKYELAASHNDAESIYNLAMLYSDRHLPVYNQTAAQEYWRECAALGEPLNIPCTIGSTVASLQLVVDGIVTGFHHALSSSTSRFLSWKL